MANSMITAAKKVLDLFGKAIREYNLNEADDRPAVAISGPLNLLPSSIFFNRLVHQRVSRASHSPAILSFNDPSRKIGVKSFRTIVHQK